MFITSETHYPPLIDEVIFEKTIMDIPDNLSGITWDETTNTLIAVTNRPAKIFQLDPTGQVLQQIPLTTMEDTESIAFIDKNLFFIAEERNRRISPIAIDFMGAHTTPQGPALVFDLGGRRNYGIEGVAYSPQNDTLFIANEKLPAAVYKINGVTQKRQKGIKIEKIFSSTKDISGLAWNADYQRLYVLSDEAKTVYEMDSNGTVFRASVLSDFIKHIPQPEGIAVHHNMLYIVSEPNLFYALKIQGDSQVP